MRRATEARPATVITTESGKSTKDGVNEPHRWAALTGTFHGHAAGARIDDSPTNPGYPANGWLLRHGFGFLNPYFPGLRTYTLQPGQPLKLRYTVTVFNGSRSAAVARSAQAKLEGVRGVGVAGRIAQQEGVEAGREISRGDGDHAPVATPH